MKKWVACSGVLVCLLSVAGWRASHAEDTKTDQFSPYVSADGSIERPTNFRTEFVHMGSWFVPEGDASGFHDVYTQQSTVEAFRETGQFPDGAVLVKELRAATAGNYTTGSNVTYANDQLKQWFVMVKDAKGRFPDNPLWGRGWGWALFKPDAPSKNVATNYQTDCLGCHVPAQSRDWVYSEAYPTLKK
jgi:hypothetical protein